LPKAAVVAALVGPAVAADQAVLAVALVVVRVLVPVDPAVVAAQVALAVARVLAAPPALVLVWRSRNWRHWCRCWCSRR
jgi:hypothetical protein